MDTRVVGRYTPKTMQAPAMAVEVIGVAYS